MNRSFYVFDIITVKIGKRISKVNKESIFYFTKKAIGIY
jgi:hypothetical protein